MCSCQENLVGCEWPEAKSSLLLPGASIERGLQRCGHCISSTRPIPQVGASEWTNWSDAVATKADARVQTVCCVPRISNLYIRWYQMYRSLWFFTWQFSWGDSQAVGPETPEPPTLCHVQCSATRSTDILGHLGSRDVSTKAESRALSIAWTEPFSCGFRLGKTKRATKNHKEPQRRTKIINMIKFSPSPSPSSWNNQK